MKLVEQDYLRLQLNDTVVIDAVPLNMKRIVIRQIGTIIGIKMESGTLHRGTVSVKIKTKFPKEKFNGETVLLPIPPVRHYFDQYSRSIMYVPAGEILSKDRSFHIRIRRVAPVPTR